MTRLFLRIFLVVFLAFIISSAVVSHILFESITTQLAEILPPDVRSTGQLSAIIPVWTKALMIGTVIVVVTLTGAALTFPFVRRLKRLEVAAARITEGDFSARAQVRSKTIIGSLAKRFNLMADRIQGLLENQKHLVHAVAHELRTPIARVRFGLEMMSAAKNETERNRREHEIVEDLEELDRLIEELVIFSRYDSGASQIKTLETDMTKVVNKQILKFRPIHPDTEIEIVTAPDSTHSAMVDPRLIDKVIQNLLSNGTRYAKNKVTITLRSETDSVTVTVSDDGPGIPPEDRQRVLEPFTRLDTSRNRQSGGFGLGLAIVNKIVTVHGGKVSIGETKSGGAKIETSWPRA